MDGKEPVSYLILMKSEFSVEIACNYILIFFALGASSKLNSRWFQVVLLSGADLRPVILADIMGLKIANS